MVNNATVNPMNTPIKAPRPQMWQLAAKLPKEQGEGDKSGWNIDQCNGPVFAHPQACKIAQWNPIQPPNSRSDQNSEGGEPV